MGSWPDPTPFELEDGSIPSSLDALISGAGSALPGVLLVAESRPERTALARLVAVRVARAWVRTGRRIILADLQLEAPGLHEWAGTDNDQGIVDHFHFGTSLELLAVPVEDGAWSLVPAGPWVGGAGEVLRAPGWSRLLAECAARDATLLAFLTADSPALPELAQAFGAVLVIGEVRELAGVSPYSVVAVLELGGAPPEAAVAAAGAPVGEVTPTPAPAPGFSVGTLPQPEAGGPVETPDEAFERIRLPTDARTREQLIADLRFRQRAARMAPPSEEYRPSLADQDADAPPAGVVQAAGVLSPEAAAVPALGEAGSGQAAGPRPAPLTSLMREPPPAARIVLPPPRRSRAPLWWTVAVLGLLSLLAGSWHFMQARLRARAASDEAARKLELPMRLPQPMPVPPAPDTVLAYVVAMEEHVRLPSALERVNALGTALPRTGHFVVPVVRDQSLYYRVAAGPVADQATAAALLDSLLVKQLTVASDAEVQRAPLAFLLGEYTERDSADARVNGLRRLEIPSYVIAVAGPPERYRIFAGGYAESADAQVMREILQSVGEADALVERVGRR